MKVKVGINGFGRIGRLVYRAMLQRPDEFDVVAVNDLAEPKQLALLLKYDTVHGQLAGTVESGDGKLIVNGNPLQVLKERDPSKLPWKSHGARIVVESTGFFTERRNAEKNTAGYDDHLKGGAEKVIISAPAKKPDLTVVLGVNDDNLKKEHTFISNASCTTNCLAPMAKVLHDHFKIVHGTMNTVHAYTNDQKLADLVHEDPRRARAAAANIIPSKTGAAAAIGEVLPDLKGRLNGMALRVPVPDGSITDLTVILEKEVTVDEINAAFQKAAADAKGLGRVLEYTRDPIVSSDIVRNPKSCIFDSLSTMVIPTDPSEKDNPKAKGKLVKVLGWYDNEWGYSNRTADIVAQVAKLL